MKSTGSYLLIVVLGLGLVGESAIAWKQHEELIVLRAQGGLDNSADLQKRLADAQKRLARLEDQLAALRKAAPENEAVNADDLGRNPSDQRVRPDFRAGIQATMNSPEFQKLMALQQKAQLDSRYGALFKSLNLTPGQLDQFKNLLVQKQQAMQDALSAARQQGVSPRNDPAGFQEAIAGAEAAVDQQIQASLGSADFSQYQQYEQTLPQRNTVNQVDQALSYSPTPLTASQANQLTTILAQDQAAATGAAGGENSSLRNLLNGSGAAPITSQAVADAQSILSPPQLQALQQVQQAQQAQAQMQQMVRAAEQAARAAASATTSAPGGG